MDHRSHRRHPGKGQAWALCRPRAVAVAVLIGALAQSAIAQNIEESLRRCAGIDEATARLACYDALQPGRADDRAGPAGGTAVEAAPAAGPAPVATDGAGTVGNDAGARNAHASDGTDSASAPAASPPAAGRSDESTQNVLAADLACPQTSTGDASPLTAFWELNDKCGRFGLKTYRPNYLMPGRYSNSPDAHPTSPTHPDAPAQSARRTEAKFQLSFRFKVFEDLPVGHADFWAAYTQQSSWQLYDAANSRPFRETDYEPEVMLVLPTRYDTHLFGLTGRYVSLGLVHQSNGQSDPLSRSWNRVYAQFGFDAGEFSLQVRPWYRLHEAANSDDNPDLEHYLGHGDLLATWRHEKVEASLLLRNNFQSHSNRGAAKLDVSFLAWPQHNLRLYAQAFSGYGETLIDYNHRQTTLGLGIMLAQ